MAQLDNDDWLDCVRRRFRSGTAQRSDTCGAPLRRPTPPTGAGAMLRNGPDPVCDAYAPYIDAACRRAADERLRARRQP